jgi:divalent metal cation (Fe/Co/Zn/Cd) transporter
VDGRSDDVGDAGHDHPLAPVGRGRDLQRALWLSALSIAWSGAAGALAVYAALASGSLSLLGFGVDAVIDSAASVALIWRFRVETRERQRADRVEQIAEGVVGAALIVLALYLVVGSLRSLAAQSHPDASTATVALLLASAVVLPVLATAKYRVAGRLRSRALRADSILTAVAALLAAISLASLALVDAFGLWWADALGALVVALIVLREGVGSVVSSRRAGVALEDRGSDGI